MGVRWAVVGVFWVLVLVILGRISLFEVLGKRLGSFGSFFFLSVGEVVFGWFGSDFVFGFVCSSAIV